MTEHINDFIVSSLQHYGLFAIFLLMLVESACIPVPAEATMLYAGYLVSTDEYSLGAVIVVGVLGNLAGSVLIWSIGATGGRRLLERHGRWVGIRTSHIHQADEWFERRGSAAVLIGRVLPIVRTFISLPAGVARMPLAPFVAYTAIGCVPFVSAFAALGLALGPKWDELHGVLRGLDVIVAVAILGTLALVVRRHRTRRAAARA